jgi:nucleotide-binding universal stress UspA family protein
MATRTNGRHRVIVAYDGSQASRKALARAAELSPRHEPVAVVNVIAHQGVSARIDPIGDAKRARQDRLLDEAEQLLAEHGVEAETIAAVGDPCTEIIAAAEAISADVIVIGRREKRRHHLRGSLSAKLVRAARRDVLIVNHSG